MFFEVSHLEHQGESQGISFHVCMVFFFHSQVWRYPNVKNAILMQAQHAARSQGEGKLSSVDTLDTMQDFPETEAVEVSWLQDNLGT